MHAVFPGLAIALVIVHGAGLVFLRKLGLTIETSSRARGLPPWVAGQADRNQRRSLPMAVTAIMLVFLALLMRVAGLVSEWWLGFAAVAIGFNLGSIAVGALTVIGQSRLLRLVKEQSERLLDPALAEAEALAG